MGFCPVCLGILPYSWQNTSRDITCEQLRHIHYRITAHPRGAFISVRDWTPTETNLLLLTHLKEVGVFSTEINLQGRNHLTVTAALILFLLYTSEEIADCPRNTHSRCNSKCKEKSIPSIFQCLYRVPSHYTVHAVIKCTSGNQRNNRSYKKGCRRFFTDSCKNFRIHIYNKACQQ